MKLITLACTAALSLATLSIAHAGSSTAVPTQTVQLGDLDLSHAQGNATLYHRVSIAARSVCRDQEPSSLALLSLHKRCMDLAMAGAVAGVNRPEFTAYVASKLPALATIHITAR
jgi:UrcA family protein